MALKMTGLYIGVYKGLQKTKKFFTYEILCSSVEFLSILLEKELSKI